MKVKLHMLHLKKKKKKGYLQHMLYTFTLMLFSWPLYHVCFVDFAQQIWIDIFAQHIPIGL